ncbi:MAG: lactate utilization protein [Chitinophagaceae bacterium]|jgi:L-lactate dehydrogenase complex protein LldG|nr:lactate utilization protein [Chitinophagaceae bacterium]OQY93454.1 MAG: lactate utilization protein B/C [Sphingobacteriales bacterium UTBCD1]
MAISPSKENILKKIRMALSHSTPLPFPQSESKQFFFRKPGQEPELEFADQFTKLQGKFIYCLNHSELVTQLKDLLTHREWSRVYCCEDALKSVLRQNGFTGFSGVALKDCDVSITGCEALVARTGSIVMSAAQQSGRTVSVYAPVHICIAYVNQLVFDIKDALQLIKDKYGDQLPSLITFATGPSRTADIEKTLVVGVHGPKEVYLLLVEA